MNIAKLHEDINKVVPITGLSIGKIADRSTWIVQYIEKPADSQVKEIQNIIETFDINIEPINVIKEALILSLKGAVLIDPKDILMRDELLAKFDGQK